MMTTMIPETWGTLGSTVLTFIFFWDMFRRYCPAELRRYLEEHLLFQSIEELLEEVEITPADVAEHLMPKSAKEGPDQCLLNLIRALEEIKERTIIRSTEEIEDNQETNKNTSDAQEKHET